MLNELLSLKNAISQMNVSLKGNPDIQDFSAEYGLLVIVDSDDSLIIKPIGTSQNRWRYFPHNHLSFPTAKVSGLLVEPESLPDSFVTAYKAYLTTKKKSERDTFLEKLNEMIVSPDFSYGIINDSKRLNDFRNIWTSTALKLWKSFGSRLEQVEPVYTLVQILKDSPTEDLSSIQEKFHQFTDAILRAARSGLIDLSLVLKLLLGKYDSQNESWVPVPDREAIPLYFDIPGEKVTLCRNDFENMLQQSQSGQSNEIIENLPVCALTGKHLQPVEDTFPQVILPVLKKSALFAMNRDIPCHDRYGKIASDICIVGQETANQLAEALRFITSDSKEGKTWKRIISDKEKKSDLLIVYCETKPVNDAELAGYFDDYEDVEFDDDIDDDKDFTEKTKAVIDLLNCQTRDVDTYSIKCLIIRELDPGRRQLLYSDSFTVGDLKEDAKLWQEGSRNVPERHFWIFKNAKSKKSEKVGLTTISFKTAQELFQMKWIRGGTESCRTPGVSRGDIFALFLQRNYATCQANDLLRRLLENCYNLFVFVGAKIHLNKYNDISNEQRKRTLHCLEMIGVLLKILDYNMEVYMNQTAYNLGRLLALADQLHIFYCQDLRSGDVPMSLIGNALLPVAKTNPSQALSRLYDRLQIYMGWAKKYSNSKTPEEKLKAANKPAPGLVAWVMREITNVSNAIKDAMKESGKQLTDKLSDVEAAQLLLGYLAPNKGKNIPDSDDEQDETEESEK